MPDFIYYHGPVTPQGIRNLQILILESIKRGNEEVVVGICSGGGDVNSGVGFYNFAKSIKASIHTHNMGACGSIAATIFLAGTRRTAAPMSNFMLHAATYVDGPRKDQVSYNTQLVSFPFKKELGWTDEIIDHYFSNGEEKLIALIQAKEMGILHEVKVIEFNAESCQIVSIV